MRKRFIAPLVAIGAVGATMALSAGVASAHHPTITAEAVCDENGQFVISYTSTAWSSGTDNPERANPQIDILFDGTVVGSGAYTSPDYSFSGSAAVPADADADGAVLVRALAVGSWGNGVEGGQYEDTYVVLPTEGCTPVVNPANGRFTGGGHQVRVGEARVTRGLTIHCDLLLSNNLEVNWGGNQFHMTEHLTTVACTDDPAIIQAPPAAPLDTLIGVGTGRYNGTDGYTIEFTLVDYGEPGRDDQARLYIYETANPANVVLNVPLQLLTGGNLQAHYDQPHK